MEVDHRAQLAACLGQQGLAERALGEPAEAALCFEESSRIYEELQRLPGGNPQLANPHALAHFHLGATLRGLGEPKKALAEYGKAQEIWRRAGEQEDFAPRLTETLEEIGTLHYGQGQHEAAREAYEQALSGNVRNHRLPMRLR